MLLTYTSDATAAEKRECRGFVSQKDPRHKVRFAGIINSWSYLFASPAAKFSGLFVSDKRTGRLFPDFLRVSGLTTPAGYDCNIDPLLDSQSSNQRPFEGCPLSQPRWGIDLQYMGIYQGKG